MNFNDMLSNYCTFPHLAPNLLHLHNGHEMDPVEPTKEHPRLMLHRFVPTCAGDGINAGPVVLHNGSGATLHSQDAGHLQDHVFGGRPAGQGARQLHANHLITTNNKRALFIWGTIQNVLKWILKII